MNSIIFVSHLSPISTIITTPFHGGSHRQRLSLLKFASHRRRICCSSSSSDYVNSGDNTIRQLGPVFLSCISVCVSVFPFMLQFGWMEIGRRKNVILSNFCIIEGPETVQDFVQMQMQEIEDNIKSRRNKIFLLMEEVRRLRVQQRLKEVKAVDATEEEANEMPDIPSSIPFLPHVTPKTLKQLYLTSFTMILGIIVFGGLLAPSLELRLGLGGTSYEDFIRSMHLPMQLSQVDPIVASFAGGAVGVISTLMLIEVNNVEQQEKKRCKYCHGSGYLACARCSASGVCLKIEPISISGDSQRPLQAPTTQRCPNCSGAGKVMCPTCLCTGMMMASEHDPRIEPFD